MPTEDERPTPTEHPAAPAGDAPVTRHRPMPDELGTRRLALRSLAPTDAPWFRDLLAERDGGPNLTPTGAAERLEGHRRAAPVQGFGFYAVRWLDAAPAAPALGYVGLVVGRCSIEEPELAYELFREHRGLGVATEASAVVVDAARATGRARLWATIRADNASSLRVAARLGFTIERRTTDVDGEVVWLALDLVRT